MFFNVKTIFASAKDGRVDDTFKTDNE